MASSPSPQPSASRLESIRGCLLLTRVFCNRDLPALSLEGLSSGSHRFDFVEGCLTRLPTKKAGLEIQAKVCDKCGQLVLTYRQSMSCIVCGGPLKPVKS